MSITHDDNWIDRAPFYLRELEGPRGEECPTTIDRRWLWRLLWTLREMPPAQLTHDLSTYLHASCVHHWRYDAADDCGCPALRQCVWCTEVELLDSAGRPLPQEPPVIDHDPWAGPLPSGED